MFLSKFQLILLSFSSVHAARRQGCPMCRKALRADCDPCRPVPPTACRYLSHFRSVHRGAYFAELRTTTVRKLLPESWGFFCPVHTPDGSPCGLLNHLTADSRVVAFEPENPEEIESAITRVGEGSRNAAGPGMCLSWGRGSELGSVPELGQVRELGHARGLGHARSGSTSHPSGPATGPV